MHAYDGVWELIPELSLYQQGQPPASGTYTLRTDAGVLSAGIRWRMSADAPEQSTAFGGPDDGTPQALPARPGGPDAFTITRIDAHTLDSAALRDGRVLAYARRRASNDGRLLAVVQETHLPDGAVLRNFQVYRRAA